MARGCVSGGNRHVTGGGLPGNLPRAVREPLAIALTLGGWPEPAVFRLMRELGRLTDAGLRATFNCGIGMALVVEPAAVDRSIAFLAERGLAAWQIGCVIPAGEAGAGRYVEVGP